MSNKKIEQPNSHFDFLFGNNNLLKSKRSNSHFDFAICNNNLSKSKRSQTAVEFVILVGFVLFFFSIFLLVIQENMSDKLKEKKNLAIKEIALTVQDEINLALEASDGYSRSFNLPEKIGSQDYKINITKEMVYVRTVDNKYAIALPVANVTGDIRKDVNIIKKENGEIKLNQ